MYQFIIRSDTAVDTFVRIIEYYASTPEFLDYLMFILDDLELLLKGLKQLLISLDSSTIQNTVIALFDTLLGVALSQPDTTSLVQILEGNNGWLFICYLLFGYLISSHLMIFSFCLSIYLSSSHRP